MDGTTIDGFRLTARLGAGEDGEVYRAQAADGGAWALRLLSPQRADHGRIAAIQRSLAALTRAAIPGVLIPRTIPHGRALALAAPLLDGEDLGALLARLGRLPWPAVRDIGLAIADPLAALHRAGLVFGGLRPSKCFVDRSGRIWLRDVGLARNEATPAGAPWMSPEQAAGGPGAAIDARTDVYAFGALLHALLAGEPVFTGAPAQVAMMQRFKAPRPLRRIDRAIEVPAAVEAAILRALEKDPRRRFAGVDELRELLADASTPGAAAVPGATLAGVLAEETTTVVQPLRGGDPGGEAMVRGASRSGVIEDTLAPPAAVTIEAPAGVTTPGRPSTSAPAGPSPARPPEPPALALASPLLAAPRLTAQARPPSPLAPSPHDAALPAPAGATPPPWTRRPPADLFDLRRDPDDEAPATLVSAPPLMAAGEEATAVLPVYAPEPAREAGETAIIPGFGGARLLAGAAVDACPSGHAHPGGSKGPRGEAASGALSRTSPQGQAPSDMSPGTATTRPEGAALAAPAHAPALATGDFARPGGPLRRARTRRPDGLLAGLAGLPALLRRGWTAALAPLRRLLGLRGRLLGALRGLRGRVARLTRHFTGGAP